MNTINLLKNNFKRIMTHNEVLVVSAIVIPIFIGVAILFSAKTNMVLSLAYVSDQTESFTENDKYKVDVVSEKPDKSALLMGKYSAIVEKDASGDYNIETIKSDKDAENIRNYFRTGKVEEDKERGVGTNILGFSCMILIMQAVALTILYPDDRIKKTFTRIMTAPVKSGQYILAQGILTFLWVFIPTYVVIALIHVIFSIDVGYSLGTMALLLGIFSMFSTTFALCISSLVENNTSLLASSISMITCVLAGCFKSFTDNNKILDFIVNILPQKPYMTLIQGIEGGKKFLDFTPQLIYMLVWIVGLGIVAAITTRQKVKRGLY